jgi:hypothetical protein
MEKSGSFIPTAYSETANTTIVSASATSVRLARRP